MVKDDGTYEKLDSGYSLMKIYDNYTVRVEQRFPFNVENIQIKKTSEKIIEIKVIQIILMACTFMNMERINHVLKSKQRLVFNK